MTSGGCARTLLVTTAAVAVLGTGTATRGREPAHAFLATSFHLTAADLVRLDRGLVVSRTLPADDRREIATLGAVRVGVTPEFYVQQLADIAQLKQDAAVLQIGTFGDPPTLGDIAGLSLDEADIRSLRRCRVEDCGIQLPVQAIERFRQQIDWNRADAARRANELMRQFLVEYVTDYMRSGAAASMEYADVPARLHVGREFASLASEASSLEPFPMLRRHLFEYPARHNGETTDVMYWSKERIGRKGVASVTHLAIARVGAASPAEFAIASKQIYGTHYYDASLGLTVLLPAGGEPAPATYVAYLNRSRIDVFGGMFGGIVRKIVAGRARATVSDQLANLRQTLQNRFCDDAGTC